VSCQSTGTKIPQAELTQLVPGETQYTDVLARWGTPTSDTLHLDHSRDVTYVYTQGQASPLNFVPFVRVFVSGSTSEQTTVTFTFDPTAASASTRPPRERTRTISAFSTVSASNLFCHQGGGQKPVPTLGPTHSDIPGAAAEDVEYQPHTGATCAWTAVRGQGTRGFWGCGYGGDYATLGVLHLPLWRCTAPAVKSVRVCWS
jgi:hypothetical protein